MAESGKVYQIQYPTTVSGKVYNVRDVSGEQNVAGKVYQVASVNGGGGITIRNQDINVTQNGVYQAEDGYTGLGTVNVNVASGSSTQKIGVTIDNFIGDVDDSGQLSAPVAIEDVNLAGVKSIAYYGLQYAFAGRKINRFIADDVENPGVGGLYKALQHSSVKHASFDSIVEINAGSAFQDCFSNCDYLAHLSYKKLKKIKGLSVFQGALDYTQSLKMTYDEIFPSLEEVSGDSALYTGRPLKANDIIAFSKVKKITGSTGQYSSTFGSFYIKDTVWNFPSATEFTGYIWNASASYPGEIHFAAANQAAIEACDGYANKWGFAGATIYFDL